MSGMKRVSDILLLKPAFSGRNMTSLALVAIFFGVYVAAGGKVSAVPKIKTNNTFGGVDLDADPARNQAAPKSSLTSDLNDALKDLTTAPAATTPAAKSTIRDTVAPSAIDSVDEKSSADDDDQLAEIEKRLKANRSK